MVDWYDIHEGEEYRHRLTGNIVRVRHFAGDEGFTGRVEWETVDHRAIEGQLRARQEAQHFLEDFELLRAS